MLPVVVRYSKITSNGTYRLLARFYPLCGIFYMSYWLKLWHCRRKGKFIQQGNECHPSPPTITPEGDLIGADSGGLRITLGSITRNYSKVSLANWGMLKYKNHPPILLRSSLRRNLLGSFSQNYS